MQICYDHLKKWGGEKTVFSSLLVVYQDGRENGEDGEDGFSGFSRFCKTASLSEKTA
jgi:hypothetical protein